MSGTNPFSDNDERTSKGEFVPPRFEEGEENSHNLLDSKDERSIANHLAHAEQRSKEEHSERASGQIDPTFPARNQGHEPSKGAKIDKELQEEDQRYLEKKGGA